ncbi:hypothetical protein Bcep1808_7438 (plasmid) [Burkholderia vietnamiensis G4]|uniref:Uncharacterized protein n=1 Tax=Burkholderia vietnamiensis (strain G4 / LMG 22486) TaxID=269482 RepID=A4JVL2_BURVG|nr:hypothetical protein Bcep1808_7438 [Burkholderia vietnamiensis G4]
MFSCSERLLQHGRAILRAQQQIRNRREHLGHELQLNARTATMLCYGTMKRRARCIKLRLILGRNGADRSAFGIGQNIAHEIVFDLFNYGGAPSASTLR